jgi:hypothetical protein
MILYDTLWRELASEHAKDIMVMQELHRMPGTASMI